MAQQGKDPVIALTLKDLKESNWEFAYTALIRIMSDAFRRHQQLLEPVLDEGEKGVLTAFLAKRKDFVDDWKQSLRLLCQWLNRATGIKPWILMDEYDTPLIEAHMRGYTDEALDFFRIWLGLKKQSGLGTSRLDWNHANRK